MSDEQAEVTTLEPTLTLSLQAKQDDDDDNNDNDDEVTEEPYRLVKIGRDVLVYGGVDGLLVRAQDQMTVRRWEDDALRAVAASPNQKMIAVGLDSGEVEIYHFDDYVPTSTDAVHPFCDTHKSGDDDDDDAFLSQSDRLTCPLPSDKKRMGPRADSSVRELLFLNDIYLAIATESGLVVTDISQGEEDMPTYLVQEAKQEHNGSGIKGLAWNAIDEILTTLAMQGDVCYWKCPLASPADSWTLWRKEPNLKVLKKDVGECLGASAMDRATRPHQNGRHLAIPGSNLWQLVEFQSNPELDYKELFQNDTVHNKHTVVIRSRDAHWITTDRDGKIVLWELVSASDNHMLYFHKLGRRDAI